MPRHAREKSGTGIYHIMIRGANKQELFHDDEDRLRFLWIFNKVKARSEIKIYGWCLMNNHIHLLLQVGNENLSTTMKRLGVSFVWYYNQKYRTTGHLFQDRFRSENIETDKSLLTVIRYIHQNPVNAGLVKRSEEWKWSSCGSYYGFTSYPKGLLDQDLVLGLFSKDKKMAKLEFRQFNVQKSNDSCLDDRELVKFRLSDDEARMVIIKEITGIEIAQVKSLSKKQRDEVLHKVKGIEKISQRQAARILGVSPSLIFKA